jgi:hypothetical protein
VGWKTKGALRRRDKEEEVIETDEKGTQKHLRLAFLSLLISSREGEELVVDVRHSCECLE